MGASQGVLRLSTWTAPWWGTCSGSEASYRPRGPGLLHTWGALAVWLELRQAGAVPEHPVLGVP